MNTTVERIQTHVQHGKKAIFDTHTGLHPHHMVMKIAALLGASAVLPTLIIATIGSITWLAYSVPAQGADGTNTASAFSAEHPHSGIHTATAITLAPQGISFTPFDSAPDYWQFLQGDANAGANAGSISYYADPNGNGYATGQYFDRFSLNHSSDCSNWDCRWPYQNNIDLGAGHFEYQTPGTIQLYTTRFTRSFDTHGWTTPGSEFLHNFTAEGLQAETASDVSPPLFVAGALLLFGSFIVGLVTQMRHKRSSNDTQTID